MQVVKLLGTPVAFILSCAGMSEQIDLFAS